MISWHHQHYAQQNNKKPTRITKSSYFDFQFDPQVPREPPSSRLPSSSRLIVIFKYLNEQYGVLQIFENPIWSSRTRIFHENQSYLQQWKNSVPSVLSAFDDTQDCQAVFFAKYFVPLVIPDQTWNLSKVKSLADSTFAQEKAFFCAMKPLWPRLSRPIKPALKDHICIISQ